MNDCSTVIFGGTFNPPHIVHEEIVKTLNTQENIKRILLVPTGEPVHKATEQTAKSHRKKMCEIVAEKFEKASVWDIELNRKEKSYTVLTLMEYKKLYGDTPYLLMGADMLVTLRTWYKYRDLIKLCHILAVARQGGDNNEFLKAIEEIKADGATITKLDCEFEEISSTDIRGGESYGVSKEIAEYIKKNNLYKGTHDMTIREYKEHIKCRLTEGRYFHSLCVAEEAVRLADRYGGDKQKAFIAGLLHDVLKDTNPDEQLKLAKQFGIILSSLELGAKKLYHSIIGSAYVKNVLNIQDDEIINAIRYHTTAKADMSLLEKIIYLADYTSRDRDYNGVEEMREAVEVSMEKALKVALEFTIEDLKQKGVPCHPDTLAAYEYYVGK